MTDDSYRIPDAPGLHDEYRRRARSALEYFGDGTWRNQTEFEAWVEELAQRFEDADWATLYEFKRDKASQRAAGG